jgi:hypothetical protein
VTRRLSGGRLNVACWVCSEAPASTKRYVRPPRAAAGLVHDCGPRRAVSSDAQITNRGFRSRTTPGNAPPVFASVRRTPTARRRMCAEGQPRQRTPHGPSSGLGSSGGGAAGHRQRASWLYGAGKHPSQDPRPFPSGEGEGSGGGVVAEGNRERPAGRRLQAGGRGMFDTEFRKIHAGEQE